MELSSGLGTPESCVSCDEDDEEDDEAGLSSEAETLPGTKVSLQIGDSACCISSSNELKNLKQKVAMINELDIH